MGKKLAALALGAGLLFGCGMSEQDKILQNLDKTRVFDKQEYREYFLSYSLDTEIGVRNELYDLNKNGVPDLGISFDAVLEKVYPDGSFDYSTSLYPNIVVVNKDENENFANSITYYDFDQDGILETKEAQ